MDASEKILNASKVTLTGTVSNVSVGKHGTRFIRIETPVLECLPPVIYVAMVRKGIADSTLVQPGDRVTIIEGILYGVAADGTIKISVRAEFGIQVCAKNDGIVDAASELM